MDISFMHSLFIIFIHRIFISHCISIHIHLACFLFRQLHTFCCHHSHVMFTHAPHLHKSLHFHRYSFSMFFCSDNYIHFVVIIHVLCSLMHHICISHCISIHIHLACFFSKKLHTFCCHHSHVMFTHAWSYHIVSHALHFPLHCKKKPQWSVKVHTALLVAYVEYHDDSYKQNMLGLYTSFSWKWLKITWTWYTMHC